MKMVKKIWEIIKRYWRKLGFLIIVVPITFIGLTRFLYDVLPGRKIATESDWISFSGSYLGIIGAIGIFWWQMKVEKQKSIDEKKEKEKDEILNLLNEILFFSTKDNTDLNIKAIQAMFSFKFDEYSTEKEYSIITGNWSKILEEDRKILFSKKMKSLYYKNIYCINEINKDYFTFLRKKNFIKDIYEQIFNSKKLNDYEKNIIDFFNLNIGIEIKENIKNIKKYEDIKNNMSKYLENIQIEKWKETIIKYKLGPKNDSDKIDLFLNLVECLFNHVIEKDDVLKEELLEKKKAFKISISYLKSFNERIKNAEDNLIELNKESTSLKKELED